MIGFRSPAEMEIRFRPSVVELARTGGAVPCIGRRG